MVNNFIFENATKTYFGKGCVKEYLCAELVWKEGADLILGVGGGSVMDCCKAIADSCNIAPGSYKRLTHEEIYQIFQECR